MCGCSSNSKQYILEFLLLRANQCSWSFRRFSLLKDDEINILAYCLMMVINSGLSITVQYDSALIFPALLLDSCLFPVAAPNVCDEVLDEATF